MFLNFRKRADFWTINRRIEGIIDKELWGETFVDRDNYEEVSRRRDIARQINELLSKYFPKAVFKYVVHSTVTEETDFPSRRLTEEDVSALLTGREIPEREEWAKYVELPEEELTESRTIDISDITEEEEIVERSPAKEFVFDKGGDWYIDFESDVYDRYSFKEQDEEGLAIWICEYTLGNVGEKELAELVERIKSRKKKRR